MLDVPIKGGARVDRTSSPSSFYGVTTVMAGGCEFSIAPVTEDAGDDLMSMLAGAEGSRLAARAREQGP